MNVASTGDGGVKEYIIYFIMYIIYIFIFCRV